MLEAYSIYPSEVDLGIDQFFGISETFEVYIFEFREKHTFELISQEKAIKSNFSSILTSEIDWLLWWLSSNPAKFLNYLSWLLLFTMHELII